jgi:hypothetical protein
MAVGVGVGAGVGVGVARRGGSEWVGVNPAMCTVAGGLGAITTVTGVVGVCAVPLSAAARDKANAPAKVAAKMTSIPAASRAVMRTPHTPRAPRSTAGQAVALD